MRILEKYAKRKLLRKAKLLKRIPELPNFKTFKKVGVIWQPDQKNAFLFLQDYISKKKIIFRSLCVFEENSEIVVDANSLTPKDLNWMRFPKPGKINGFTEMDFDLLLNLALVQNITLDYITLITRAKFKTGWSPDENNFFDLNINISQNRDSLYLAKQQIFYLRQLNKTNNK